MRGQDRGVKRKCPVLNLMNWEITTGVLEEERETAYELLALPLSNINEQFKQSSNLFEAAPRVFFEKNDIFEDPNLVRFDIMEEIRKRETREWIPNYYYELSRSNRLRDVMYMIGHIMMKYGKGNPPPAEGQEGDHPAPNFIFVKVDSLLYLIGLDNNPNFGNLYIKSIGCFFAYDNQQSKWTLTMFECDEISKAEKEERITIPGKKIPGIPYAGFTEIIKRRLGKLWSAETQIAFEQNALKNLFYNEGDFSLNAANELKANHPIVGYIAAELAMAIFAESIRSPDTIPSTLKLIQIREFLRTETPTTQPFIEKYWKELITKDIHPMTGGGTWIMNTRWYQTGVSTDVSTSYMWSVGFFPIRSSEEAFRSHYNQREDPVYRIQRNKVDFNSYRNWLLDIKQVHDDYRTIADHYLGLRTTDKLDLVLPQTDTYSGTTYWSPPDSSDADVGKVQDALGPRQ